MTLTLRVRMLDTSDDPADQCESREAMTTLRAGCLVRYPSRQNLIDIRESRVRKDSRR
jgi:hypothetical protein